MTTKIDNSVARAVALSGGFATVAEACGVSVQAVHKWVKYARPPANRCVDLELMTGGRVLCSELRPDVFKAP